MKTPIRIAVLECDTPMDAVKAKYGTYGDVFTRLLQSGADALGMPEVVSSNKGLEISKWDVVNKQEYPELEDIDAILMTGSRKFTNCPYIRTTKLHIGHDSFESDPWILKLVDFTKKALNSGRVRTIGVCFGHQIMARAMGTKVGRNADGWEIAVIPVDLTPKGKELFKVDRLVGGLLNSSLDLLTERCRTSIKCTETLHTSIRRVLSHWVRHPCAACRGCTQRGGSSVFRVTLSSIRRLKPSSSTPDMTKVSSRMPSLKML
jgi:hypothetical protein